MPFTFPVHIFNPSSISVGLGGRAIVSPPSISGAGQVVRTDGGGFWTATFSGITLNTPDLIRNWRAWEAELDGGATRIIVPIPDLGMAPRPHVGSALASPSPLLATSSDPYFPEASAFAAPFIVATAAVAALRATEVTITVTQGGTVKGGMIFGISHPIKGKRAYQVGRVISRTGNTATVTIRPPLRQAIVAATAINFDWPSFEAILVPETRMTAEIQFGRYSTGLSVSFREAL